MGKSAGNGRMEIRPVGIVRSCYEEKFAVPRQPGLCPSAWARVECEEEFGNEDFFRGMEGFSHVWLIFGFHETVEQGYAPTVRPPRLGGNERVGVFASRSTFRPNGLGLSLCRMEGLERKAGKMLLHLGGADLIDGTPVYDVKPYLAYAESITDASCGYAADAPVRKDVHVSSECARAFAELSARDQSIVKETLALDPRPAAHDDTERIYGVRLCGVNVRFRVGKVVEVVEILTNQGEI